MTENQLPVSPHPAWKKLYAGLKDHIAHGDLLSYKELAIRLDLDPRSNKGRAQFLRCAKQILLDLNLHCENIPKIGYRVVQASEHIRCANQQVTKARKRLGRGLAIAVHIDYSKLTQEQLRLQTDALARITQLQLTTTKTLREVRKLAVAAGVEMKRLPSGFGKGSRHDEDIVN
jgi:hypothetical protein